MRDSRAHVISGAAQPRRSAQPDAALAAAPVPATEPPTENRYQLKAMPTGAAPLIVLFCPRKLEAGASAAPESRR